MKILPLLAAVVLFFATHLSPAATATVSWNPNPEPDISNYLVYRGTASQTYGPPTDVGNVTSIISTGLAGDVVYYYAVSAKSTPGVEGPKSNEVAYTVPTVTPTPSPTATPVSTSTATPTPMPSLTPTPTPTPSVTPTPMPVSISGTVFYCSTPTAVLSGATVTLTGTVSTSVQSDGFGNYIFLGLPSGGSYTVTLSHASLLPGATGVDTVDAVAVQRHFLNVVLLTGCHSVAADTDGDGQISTTDSIAIQRFYSGSSSGIGNVGIYEFSPPSRTYNAITTDQAGQDYNSLVFGDTVSETP